MGKPDWFPISLGLIFVGFFYHIPDDDTEPCEKNDYRENCNPLHHKSSNS